MRRNMDPLTPATSTLAPAISHIAETAATLSKELAAHVSPSKQANTDGRAKEVQTVRWVLDAPRRFRYMLDNDRKADVEDEWTVIKGLLDKWKGVEGVTEVKRQCEQALISAANGTST
jgi:vacuolar protein sorting-associated protein 51